MAPSGSAIIILFYKKQIIYTFTYELQVDIINLLKLDNVLTRYKYNSDTCNDFEYIQVVSSPQFENDYILKLSEEINNNGLDKFTNFMDMWEIGYVNGILYQLEKKGYGYDSEDYNDNNDSVDSYIHEFRYDVKDSYKKIRKNEPFIESLIEQQESKTKEVLQRLAKLAGYKDTTELLSSLVDGLDFEKLLNIPEEKITKSAKVT